MSNKDQSGLFDTSDIDSLDIQIEKEDLLKKS